VEESTVSKKRLTVMFLAMLVFAGLASAQTSTAPGIDVELYNPVDGTNRLCIETSATAWVHVYVRPGAEAFSCSPECAPPDVSGGSANLAAGALDVAFDPGRVTFVQAETNPNAAFAAIDGLMQEQNLLSGRLGWALAGDWTPDGDPSAGVLADPCSMLLLDAPGWVLRAQLAGATPGFTLLHLRRASDLEPFPLSFADVCGTPVFTEASGAIDEVGDLVVLVTDSCASVVFFDTFERGDLSAWSTTTGG
jgi:hypothetical protein